MKIWKKFIAYIKSALSVCVALRPSCQAVCLREQQEYDNGERATDGRGTLV